MPDAGNATCLSVFGGGGETMLQESQWAALSVHGTGGLWVCGSRESVSQQQYTARFPSTVQKPDYRLESQAPRISPIGYEGHSPTATAGLTEATQLPHCKQDTPFAEAAPRPITPAVPRKLRRASPWSPPDWPQGRRAGPTTKAPRSPQESPARLGPPGRGQRLGQVPTR